MNLSKLNLNLSEVNRVEVIDNTGRVYVKYHAIQAVMADVQDNGKTLKLFLAYGEEEEICND